MRLIGKWFSVAGFTWIELAKGREQRGWGGREPTREGSQSLSSSL